MNHPSELFIKSLIVDGRSNEEVIETLEEFTLPGIGEEELVDYLLGMRTRLKGKINLPAGDARDKVLREEKIYFLLHPDAVVASCTRILDCCAAKRDIYISLIGRLPHDEIAEHLNSLYGLAISGRTVEVFSHYYFNVNSLSHDDWDKVLEDIPGADGAFYKSGLEGGATVAAYKLGRDRSITIREAVHEAVAGLYASLQEVRGWSASPIKIKMLTDTITALSKAHSVINTADQELATVARELKQFKLERSGTKTIPLKALINSKNGESNAS